MTLKKLGPKNYQAKINYFFSIFKVEGHLSIFLLSTLFLFPGTILASEYRYSESRYQQSSKAYNSLEYFVDPSIPYDQALVVSGTARLETAATPKYLGLNLWTDSGKIGFFSTAFNSSGITEFRIPLSKWTFTGDSKSKEPLSASDKIIKISLYARFSNDVASKFTLEKIILSSAFGGDGTKGKVDSKTREALFLGSVEMKRELRGVHPRLFVSSAEIDSAAKRFVEDPLFFSKTIPASDETSLSQSPRPFDDMSPCRYKTAKLVNYAAAWRITKNEAYLKAIEAWIPMMDAFVPILKKGGMNNDLMSGFFMINMATLYDLLKGVAPEATVTAVRGALIKQLAGSYEEFSKWEKFPFEQNHLVIPMCGLAIGSMALLDELEESNQWLTFSRNVLARSIDAFSKDGWYFEGISYWNYAVYNPIKYAGALRRVTGEDLFTSPTLKGIGAYMAHMYLPNPLFAFDFGDWGPRVEPGGTKAQQGYDTPWHTLTSRISSYIPMYQELNDPFVRDVVQYLAPLSSRMEDEDAALASLWQIRISDNPVPLRQREGYPPWHYFDDMDIVHWRANWSDSNATAIAFKSGPPAGHHIAGLYEMYPEWKPGISHCHPDAGSFILFSKGVFLANDTGYCYALSKHHNTITVDGKGQGGERGPFNAFGEVPYSQLNGTRMTNVWTSSLVVASTAIFQDSYEKSQAINKLHRHLILVDGRFMAIWDDISSAKPHRYDWYLHTDREAVEIGTDRWKMENGNARLLIQNLIPVEVAQIAPTIVDTELYSKIPRPQQRGFNLNLSSPKLTDWNFFTALAIQDSTNAEGTFTANLIGTRGVELTEGKDTCRLWIGDQAELSGSFGFVLKSGGKLKAIGFSGHRLTTEYGTFSYPKGGAVTFRPITGGKWEVDGASPGEIVLP